MFNNKPPASWVARITRDFLHVISVCIIIPWFCLLKFIKTFFIIYYGTFHLLWYDSNLLLQMSEERIEHNLYGAHNLKQYGRTASYFAIPCIIDHCILSYIYYTFTIYRTFLNIQQDPIIGTEYMQIFLFCSVWVFFHELHESHGKNKRGRLFHYLPFTLSTRLTDN